MATVERESVRTVAHEPELRTAAASLTAGRGLRK